MSNEIDNSEDNVALIGIVVNNPDSVSALNATLHEFGDAIIGRMGIPYREKGFSILAIFVDAPADTISALSGRIGMIDGVTAKTMFPKVIRNRE